MIDSSASVGKQRRRPRPHWASVAHWATVDHWATGRWRSACLVLGLFTACEPGPPLPTSHSEPAPAVSQATAPSSAIAPSTATAPSTAIVKSAGPEEIEVEITGFASQEGMCRIAVYDRAADFQKPERAIVLASLAISGPSLRWPLVLPPPPSEDAATDAPRTFAIAVYHDQNGNDTLDKNNFGIPTERYGFSNNPKRGLGPPRYSQTAIDLRNLVDQNLDARAIDGEPRSLLRIELR